MEHWRQLFTTCARVLAPYRAVSPSHPQGLKLPCLVLSQGYVLQDPEDPLCMSALLKNLGVASALAEDVCASGSAPEKLSNWSPRFVYNTSRNPLYSLFSVALKP